MAPRLDHFLESNRRMLKTSKEISKIWSEMQPRSKLSNLISKVQTLKKKAKVVSAEGQRELRKSKSREAKARMSSVMKIWEVQRQDQLLPNQRALV